MKNRTITITLSDDVFSRLEDIRNTDGYPRSKSRQIAQLIKQGWERLQEEKREKTPAELVEGMKAYVSRLEHTHPSLKELNDDPRIIQFPVRQIRQFSGSA
jgi:predicted transcriptional regulator